MIVFLLLNPLQEIRGEGCLSPSCCTSGGGGDNTYRGFFLSDVSGTRKCLHSYDSHTLTATQPSPPLF